MKTRTRRTASDLDHAAEEQLDLEAITDEDLASLLFEEEPETSGSAWNLPTLTGLSLIVVGIAYLFQELGIWDGFDVSILAAMLPWLAGVMIILMGFGVLSWKPRKSRKRKKQKSATFSARKEQPQATAQKKKKKRLTRSHNKKISGVCGGIAEYLSLDPTLVRIAFVIGIIATQGPLILGYLVLAYVMPKPQQADEEERIHIIRDR